MKYYIASINRGVDDKLWMWHPRFSTWVIATIDMKDLVEYQYTSEIAAQFAISILSLDERAKVYSEEELISDIFVTSL